MAEKSFISRSVLGRFKITAITTAIGKDIQVVICGGDRPHIGAVALAQPRASLRNPEKTSATCSVLSVLGHKEDIVVKHASEKLAASLKTNVVVTAGIHWDVFKEEDVATVMECLNLLLTSILEHLQPEESL